MLSAHATRDFFRSLIATDDPPAHPDLPDLDPADGGAVGLDLYSGGVAGTEVAFYSGNGAGYTIPSVAHPISASLEAVLGLQNHDIEAASEIWAFLARHTRPIAVPALSPPGRALLACGLLALAAIQFRAGES